MKKIVKNHQIYFIFAFAIMALLFISSSQTYEQQTSVPFLEKTFKAQPFEQFLSRFSVQYAGEVMSVKTSGYYKFVEFFIRKGAHFFCYFLLGGSWFLGVYPKLKNVGISLVISWLAATGYAALDEFHQMFTGGRTPLFQDVVLDSAGALTACMLCVIVIFGKRLAKKK